MPAHQIPESAVRILQRRELDVYIIPARDEVAQQLVVVFPYESGARLAGSGVELPSAAFSLRSELGASWTFSLPDLPQFRDEYERIRNQIRHGRTGRAREQEPDIDAIHELIDVLVVVERTIEFIETSESSEQGRHYRRVSALCDDPKTVIESIEQAIESGEQHSQPAKTLARVWPFANREEAGNP